MGFAERREQVVVLWQCCHGQVRVAECSRGKKEKKEAESKAEVVGRLADSQWEQTRASLSRVWALGYLQSSGTPDSVSSEDRQQPDEARFPRGFPIRPEGQRGAVLFLEAWGWRGGREGEGVACVISRTSWQCSAFFKIQDRARRDTRLSGLSGERARSGRLSVCLFGFVVSAVGRRHLVAKAVSDAAWGCSFACPCFKRGLVPVPGLCASGGRHDMHLRSLVGNMMERDGINMNHFPQMVVISQQRPLFTRDRGRGAGRRGSVAAWRRGGGEMEGGRDGCEPGQGGITRQIRGYQVQVDSEYGTQADCEMSSGR
jgi:hypothetical protein